MIKELEEIKLLRLPEVLGIFPVSKSTWWAGIESGRFPKPIKIGDRIVAWKSKDIIDLINKCEQK